MGGLRVGTLELVVVADERAPAVTGALEAADTTVPCASFRAADRVVSADVDADAVLVSGGLDAPVEAVRRLVAATDLPVVLLADGPADRIAAALEAGAVDVYPNVATPAQFDLLAARLTDDGGAPTPTDPGDAPPTVGDSVSEVFENVTDGLVVHDPDTGEIVKVNERFCEMNGYGREDLLGETVDVVTAPEADYSFQSARERISKARADGPQLFEWRNQHRDGHTFPVEVHLAVVHLQGEEYVLASVRDITERKRREREFEQIFNAVQDAIIVMDPDTLEILDANEAYLDLLGYDDFEALRRQGVAGLSATEAGYTVEEGEAIHRRVAETGEPEVVEWHAETSAGDHRILEVKIAPAEIGGEQRHVAIHRDITERRQRQREFEEIFHGVNDIITIHDPETAELVRVNDSFCELLGYDRETLLEMDVSEFSATDEGYTQERAEAFIREVVETGEPAQTEWIVETAAGERRWLEVRGTTAEIGGRLRFVAIDRDVTERERRRQTLSSFHEATQELTTAETRDEACQRAVEAADAVLGFPLVAVHLYDEAAGHLDPVATTDRLDALEGALDPVAPGEALPWQVFVDGESVTITEPTDLFRRGVSAPDVALPLGSHGVMLVGAPTETFSAAEIELAQILAATLEAALNHVAGAHALERREQELRRQQQRADRLERLNAIIRDIEQATIEQSSRADIEAAVCERLTEVDRYDLVWVGEAPVGADELVVRTHAGDHGAYLDALALETDGGAASHPAVTALQTEAPRGVDTVAADRTRGGWRRTALRHGVQSVFAVPIRYDTTTHGVLAVASTEPQAFDEATREVLADLGRSIGYALTVTARKRALESEGTMELELAVSDEGLFPVRASAALDCTVRLERTVRRTGGSFSTFYVVDGAAPDAVVDAATAAPSVETAQVITDDPDAEAGLVEVTAPTWFGAVFTDHGAVVREATAAAGDGTLLVEAPQGADVRALVERFQQQYPGVEFRAQRSRERTVRSLFELTGALREELTDRQWEALETAYSAGYFAWPRETSGEEVADLLGVTQPTFNKHLRLAERRAFRLLLDREVSTGSGSATHD